MKKILMGAAALLFAGVLAGCNQLTQYTLSEQEVNDYLQKHNDYQKQIGVPGLVDANIVLTQLQSQIGRSEPGKVTLSGDAKVNITSILGPQTADLKLTLKAQPVYDRAQGAIFLKDMELTDYSVQPEKMQTVMKALTPYLNQSLKSYFDQKPAYVLNPDNSKTEALAKKLAKGLEVKPGELVIPFSDCRRLRTSSPPLGGLFTAGKALLWGAVGDFAGVAVERHVVGFICLGATHRQRYLPHLILAGDGIRAHPGDRGCGAQQFFVRLPTRDAVLQEVALDLGGDIRRLQACTLPHLGGALLLILRPHRG